MRHPMGAKMGNTTLMLLITCLTLFGLRDDECRHRDDCTFVCESYLETRAHHQRSQCSGSDSSIALHLLQGY